MARAGSQRPHIRQANQPHEEEHGKESEESKEDRQGDQESRQEDQENEEVSARFSASQSRGSATTIAGELDVLQDVSGRKCGDDQTGPMCTWLKKPTTDAHGSGFCVRSLVGSPVAQVSVNSPDCDLAPFAGPFVEGRRRGASSAHALTMATGCFAPKAVDRQI